MILIVTATYLFLMSVLFFRKERHSLQGTLACLELLLDTGLRRGQVLIHAYTHTLLHLS